MIGSEIIDLVVVQNSLSNIFWVKEYHLYYILAENYREVLKPIISELRLFRCSKFIFSYMSKRDKEMGILANTVAYWLSLLQRTCLYVI